MTDKTINEPDFGFKLLYTINDNKTTVRVIDAETGKCVITSEDTEKFSSVEDPPMYSSASDLIYKYYNLNGFGNAITEKFFGRIIDAMIYEEKARCLKFIQSAQTVEDVNSKKEKAKRLIVHYRTTLQESYLKRQQKEEYAEKLTEAKTSVYNKIDNW